MTRKQLILDLWAAQLTAPQIAKALGVSASYVRDVLDAAGAKLRRFDSVDEALAWLTDHAPRLSEEIGRLRNATPAQAQQPRPA